MKNFLVNDADCSLGEAEVVVAEDEAEEAGRTEGVGVDEGAEASLQPLKASRALMGSTEAEVVAAVAERTLAVAVVGAEVSAIGAPEDLPARTSRCAVAAETMVAGWRRVQGCSGICREKRRRSVGRSL